MEVMQTNFPKELFKVKMYALRPWSGILIFDI
jgi:hypothetical protein